MALIGTSRPERVALEKRLWDCLTCGKCTNYCPTKVSFPEFVRSVRMTSRDKDNCSVINHAGITYYIADAMANNDLKQKRLSWVDGTKVVTKGDVLFFTGCLPYFDTIFKHINVDGGPGMLNNAVKIMNKAGVTPVVMADEVCCGHDEIWSGDQKTFIELAKKNLKAIERTGAKRIVTICPECATTLKNDYREHLGVELDVVHITEFIAEFIKNGRLTMKKSNEKVTYHDPCRLVQHLGVVEAPRNIIKTIDPEGFVEMKESGVLASCCGTTLWRGCDALSEVMRHDRLKQAMATGATTLLTACPKCRIHFKCTLSGKCEEAGLDPKLKVKDIVTFIAENME